MTAPLILGSQSPRRQEILGYFKVPFKQASSPFDEDSVPFHGDPDAYVRAIAEGKGIALLEQFPNHWILTSDTTVYREGCVFGKPANLEAAKEMLRGLSGQWHEVYTAVSIQGFDQSLTEVAKTRVKFRDLSPRYIDLYVETTRPLDKAGSYAAQGAGGIIVEAIEGSFYNVMGLPMGALAKTLELAGIDLWEHLGDVHATGTPHT